MCRGVDHKAIHVSEVMPVRRRDRARAADLDFTLRDAVVCPHHVVVVRDRRCPDGVQALVIGQCEYLLDAHLPVWVLDGEIAQPQVGGLAHRLQLADLLDAAVEHDRPVCLFAAARSLDGDEPRGLARAAGCTTRWVTHRVVGSITTSASSPNASSVQRTGLPRSSLTTDTLPQGQ